MKKKLVVLYVVLTTVVGFSYAQSEDTNFMLPPVIANSPITNIELVDSFSKTGDSINASYFFLKIDPYFFIGLNYTTKNIDSCFAGYLLTRQTINDYRKKFIAVYSSERTESYKIFKAMIDEDQAVRKKLSICTDSFSRSIAEKQIMKTDTPHFQYLHDYVEKNGWPTYKDGSMFAQIIAMHDWKYIQYYLPHIKKSVITGNSSSRFYYNILNRAKPSDIDKLRSYKNKVSFDISYVLKGKGASAVQINDIQKTVVECSPIIYQYFVYESSDKKDFKDFMEMTKDKNYWLAWYILAKVSSARMEMTGGPQENILYNFLYSQTIGKQKKLTLFLLYK